jgi:YHS domain-containing protein
MASTDTLAQQIDSAFSMMEEKRQKFQKQETQKHADWENRLAQLGAAFDRLKDVWKPRLEVLVKKFGDKVQVKPTLTPSTREAVFEFQSDVARIRLRLRATTDHDIRKVILNYDLEIIPVLMQFDSHAELEMPLDNVNAEKVAAWTDERILSFVKTYISLHENQYYLRDEMVSDPVSGTQFPKFAAGAKLERGGRTYYFVSEETRRKFEEKNPGK